MPDVVVVGAGLIGSALAFRLAQAGARVTVIDAANPGSGTSAASFAWLNANNKPPRPYHDLNAAGMREHRALAAELGRAPWLHEGGNLEWEEDESARAELQRKVERLRSWGYAVESLSPRQVLRELEPDLAIDAAAVQEVVYYPDEAWIDPLPLIHTLQEEAARHGARLRVSSSVARIEARSGRAAGIVLDSGEQIGADLVLICAGRHSGGLAASAGFALPMANTAGLLAFTGPAPVCLQRIVHAPSLNLRPDGGGRLLLHSEALDETVDAETAPAPSLPACDRLLRRARGLLPAIGGVRIEAARIGVRPIPADGLSAVGPLPGVEGVYAVVTHSGATLCAVLAQLVTREIMSGEPAPDLASFRPARFASAPRH